MSIVVQKYGGTSVADTERIMRCARRAVAARRQGNDVAIVVSAMGKTTDELIRLAQQVTDRPSQRELDMLLATGEQVTMALMSMALHTLGEQAVSYTGHQLGIITDPVHSRAKIQSINVDRLNHEFAKGNIVVVAGFQGVSNDGQITTLGRGGSDTTAVAIAAALGVNEDTGICEIYTDVDGVYTADPRIVPSAQKILQITYEEMLELASLGAGVMHSRAVMFGRNYNVPIHVRHSGKPDTGTIITRETPDMEKVAVVGAALTPDLGRIGIRSIPNVPGVQSAIFREIAEANVLVDDIMQTESGSNADISFTVELNDLADVKVAVQRALDQLGSGQMSVEVGLAKVSVVGVGMRTHTGVAATMFKCLGDAGINIANITTSEIKISCIIPKEHGERSLQIVHDAFHLEAGTVNAAGHSAQKAMK